MNQGTFTLTFGQEPSSYIKRDDVAKEICDDFFLDFPLSHVYVITGVRGSGKTVLLTSISKKIAEKKDWIVVDVNPNREILSQVAAGLYECPAVKPYFLAGSFSISFKGFGFSIEGKEPVSNIKTVLERMLRVLNGHKKKVLITIDEMSKNSNTKAFVHDFQSLLRDGFPVFLLMTGLYENVDALQNNRNLTFLYRAPKVNLQPLDISRIEGEYRKIFKGIPEETARQLAALTKGYAFAYQVVGYLFSKYGDAGKIIEEYDRYLSVYVYDKIWESLPQKERVFLRSFDSEEEQAKTLQEKSGFTPKEYSVYRDRFIKSGLGSGAARGTLSFTLPRFLEFIAKEI